MTLLSPREAIDRLAERLGARRTPVSTYRLQLGSGLGFRGVADLARYLHDLRISDCYLSPFLEPGSPDSHGYDVADHGRFNAALGSEADYEAMGGALRALDMGQVADVVPNHMGIAGSRNAWWTDVLENGPASPCSGHFDIEWEPPEAALRQKVLLPFLGDQYGRVLENQELSLEFHGGEFTVRYYDTVLPVAPETYVQILDVRRAELEASLPKDDPHLLELRSIVTALSHLPGRDEPAAERREERARERVVIERRLAALAAGAPHVHAFVEDNGAHFNGFYQGTELWDLSLVDPDNRRPVDFALRRRHLAALDGEMARAPDQAALARHLVDTKDDGRIKLYAIRQALRARRERAALFATGQYRALETAGPRRGHVCAFARVGAGMAAVTAVPRLLAAGGFPDPPLGAAAWGRESAVLVPPDVGRRFRNAFTGEWVEVDAGRVDLAAAFASFPVAVLLRDDPPDGGERAP
jgi:maltooligosyltrehalose synthase